MFKFRTIAAIALTVLMLVPASVMAYGQPSVNLGFTTFVDGAPPAGPGFYFQEYLQYYTASKLADKDGHDLALPPFVDQNKVKVDAYISLSQFIWQSEGPFGLNVMVPYVRLEAEPSNSPIQENDTGFGDLLVGPYIQFKPVMGEKGPLLLHRIEFQLILPTGKYDDGSALNPGSNFFSFNPYWSGTLFHTPQWTTSLRLHYLWNGKNDDSNDPNQTGAIDDTQAGQAWHANFATAIEIIPKQLRIGINGYFFKQITDDKADGSDVSGSRETILAIGPGVVYHFSQDSHLFFNTYVESHAENRPEGKRLNLRFVHHF
jgi:hypothetical protein